MALDSDHLVPTVDGVSLNWAQVWGAGGPRGGESSPPRGFLSAEAPQGSWTSELVGPRREEQDRRREARRVPSSPGSSDTETRGRGAGGHPTAGDGAPARAGGAGVKVPAAQA